MTCGDAKPKSPAPSHKAIPCHCGVVSLLRLLVCWVARAIVRVVVRYMIHPIVTARARARWLDKRIGPHLARNPHTARRRHYLEQAYSAVLAWSCIEVHTWGHRNSYLVSRTAW